MYTTYLASVIHNLPTWQTRESSWSSKVKFSPKTRTCSPACTREEDRKKERQRNKERERERRRERNRRTDRERQRDGKKETERDKQTDRNRQRKKDRQKTKKKKYDKDRGRRERTKAILLHYSLCALKILQVPLRTRPNAWNCVASGVGYSLVTCNISGPWE